MPRSRITKVIVGTYIRHHRGAVFRILNNLVCQRPGNKKIVIYQDLDKYRYGFLDGTYASSEEYMLGDSNTQFGYIARFLEYKPMPSEIAKLDKPFVCPGYTYS